MPDTRHYLVVDDNRAFGENIAEILEDSGARVTLVQSGQAALEAAKARCFSALLTDMRMPVVSGAKLVHEIRKVDPHLPALVMTAYTGDSDLEAARAEGLLAILPKPLPIKQLLQHMASARRNGLVALVEDDESLRDNLSEVLAAHGYTAVLAGSALEAGRLGCARPFAALVDLRLPGGRDGEAMLQLAERFPGLPLVVVTGHAEIEPPLPYHGLFKKPFATDALLAKLDSLHTPQ
jgi:CheY-like chemotaxis protein